MPKAWEVHKAELIRLYITECRPLKDVQSTLRRRHGFKASTRAYRMKIDEWGLQKYKTTKERPTPQRPQKRPEYKDVSFPSLPASLSARWDTSEEVQLMFGDISIPAGPVDCSDLLGRIKGPYAYRHALEILLVKWQPGGQYMRAALDFLQESRYCMRITEDPPTPNLFVLAERNVPSQERFALMKAFLEADLAFDSDGFFVHSDAIPSWVKPWRLAVKGTDWNEAKRSLWHPDLKDQFPEETTFRCFLVIIAERMLDRTKNRLEYLRTRQSPLSSSDSNDAERCRRQYIGILKEACKFEFELNPSVYKYAVQILDWDLAIAKDVQESHQKQNELLVTKEAKYRQLISMFTNKPAHIIDDSLDILLRETHVAKDLDIQSTSTHRAIHQLPSTMQDGTPDLFLRESRYEPSPQILPFKARDTLLVMHRDWKVNKKSLSGQVLLDFERDLEIQISQPAATGTKSIFDLIISSIPRNEQSAFTKAILLAYLGLDLLEYYSRPITSRRFDWLQSMALISDWTDFKRALGKVNLEDLMSVDAAKLVLEYTFVVFAERHFESCRSRIESADSSKNPQYIDSGEREHWKDQQQYEAILADLRARCANEQRRWRRVTSVFSDPLLPESSAVR